MQYLSQLNDTYPCSLKADCSCKIAASSGISTVTGAVGLAVAISIIKCHVRLFTLALAVYVRARARTPFIA